MALTIFTYQHIAFCSICKRGKILSENWNTSQTNFLKLWWIFQLGYIRNYIGCLWRGEGLGVRCGEKLTFYAVSFYVFLNFLPYVCVSFLEQNKTSYFFNLCLQRQTWNTGLLLPANSHSFSQDPVPSQHVQPVVMLWNTGGGWGTFTGTGGSAVVTPSVTQMNTDSGW